MIEAEADSVPGQVYVAMRARADRAESVLAAWRATYEEQSEGRCQRSYAECYAMGGGPTWEGFDYVPGETYRRFVYIANDALDRIAVLETTAEDAKDGLLEACERARDAKASIVANRRVKA